MKANPGTGGPVRRLHSEAGYSLVEMIIAIGVAALVGMAIYAVMNSQQRQGTSQRIYNELQTNCSFALDQMKSELLLAGYRATDSVRPIINADANTITFEYWDDNARTEAPFDTSYTNSTRVKFSVNADGELIREFARFQGTGWDETHVISQKLAGNVAALSFQYLQGDNAAWSSGDRRDIKSIRTSLTCNASRPDPSTGKVSQITLTAELRARNVDVSSSPSDVTKPLTPTGTIAWDPGACGRLELRWDANTETDLGGYTLFYGLTPGDYSERVVIPAPPRAAGEKQSYTLTGLDSAVTGVTPPRYYFALAAYDNSGNVSVPLSVEASGNPATSSRTAGEVTSNGIDSTINPLPPGQPTVISTTAGDGFVTIAWTKSPVAGLVGYRLYRGETADFTPDDTDGTGNRIANETVLHKDVVTYTDSTARGCTQYYYKLATIACDTNIPIAELQFTTVAAYPDDTTPPAAPTLTARPGYKRIILSLTNPTTTAVPDFSYTKIFYTDSRYHTTHPSLMTADSPAAGQPRKIIDPATGSPIPDNNIYGSWIASPVDNWGKFTSTATTTVNFNNYTDGNPANTLPGLIPCLNADWETSGTCNTLTYYFTAVAYDRCGNASNVTATSVTQADQCNDGISPDPTYGAPTWSLTPGRFSYGDNANIQAEGCFDYINLTWGEINSEVVDDLAGYHVYRCAGYNCPAGTGQLLTTEGPVWYPTFQDAVANGTVYSYRIQATDCYYERHILGSENNFSYDTLEALSVGGLAEETVLPEAVTGYLAANTPALPFTISAADGLTSVPPTFLHNSVSFWMKNNAPNTLTLQQYSSSWANNLAYLNTFAFGDGATTPVTIGWKEPTPGAPTQANTGSTVAMLANSRISAGDQKLPFVASFKNVDGSVSRDSDARQQTINYTLTYTNDATATPGCSVTGSLQVPLGPYVYGVVQDQPATGTTSWPRPGDQGTNAMNVVVVPGGTNVSVFANIYPATGTSVSTARLYYYVDTARTLTAAPSVDLAAQHPTLPPYTAVNLSYLAGYQWRTPAGFGIPASDGSNVWYFIVAVDSQGNFDRSPEIGSGAYQYYQQPVDVCATTPKPPTLSGSTDGMNVSLSWIAPTASTDGTTYLDGQGYKVYRDGGAGWFLLSTINDKLTLNFNDPAPPQLDTLTYRYYVTAFDTCSPDPKESAPSNFFTESAESPCSSAPSPPSLRGPTAAELGLGTSVTLTWTAPTTNATGSELTDLAGYRLWRRAGTGTATQIPGPNPDGSFPAGTLTYTDSGLLDIQTVDYSYYVTAFDSCGTGAMHSGPSNLYIDQSIPAGDCELPDPSRPNGVNNFRIAAADATGVTLFWDNPTTQFSPAGAPYNDVGGTFIARSQTLNVWDYTFHQFVPAMDTSWKDTDPTIGQNTYHYWALPFDNCVFRNYAHNGTDYIWSPPVTEFYSDPCLSPPYPPTGLNVTSATLSGVSLSWVAPYPDAGDIAGYVIERSTAASGNWVQVAGSPTNGTATTFLDNVTDADRQDYFYRVKAFDTCPTPLYSGYSNEAAEVLHFDPCNPLPLAPTWSLATPLSATPSGSCPGTASGTVALAWPAAIAAANVTADIRYEVYRCNSGKNNTTCTLVSDNQSQSPSFFTSTGAISSKTTLLTTPSLPTTVRTFTDTPGTPLKGNGLQISYLVRAVNKSCSTQAPQPYVNSIIVTPCP